MSKEYSHDKRAIEAADNILHFIECMDTYLIPVGKSAKQIKENSKKVKKLIKNYKKGKVEIFKPEFYDLLESNSGNDVLYDEEALGY